MKIEYIRNLNGSYMIIKDAEYPYENSELLMMLNNKIPGLLGLQIIISDGKMEYWYDITGTTSFCTLLDVQPMSGAKLRCLIENIFDMNRQLEEFLLDGENVQYLPELIYYDRGTEKYRFCYLPGSKHLGTNSLQALTEHLLTKIDHKDADAVSMGYALYEKSVQECCSLQELLSCIPFESQKDETEKNQGTKQYVEQEKKEEKEIGQNGYLEQKVSLKTSVATRDSQVVRRSFWSNRLGKKREKTNVRTTPDYSKQFLSMNPKEVVAEPMQQDTPTMFLNLEKKFEIGKLIYQGEGKEENFLLEEDLFLIGKDPDMVEGVIHADTVSRIHAKIYRQGGDYYIEDLNSTNGTYLNGREIFYRKPEMLKKQDRISFATEEYLFS